MECQPQVNSLQEISSSLLIKGHREDYIEAEEKVHVIEKKLKQLLEQVSQDLVSLQRSQVSPLVASKYKNVCKWESSVAALLGEGGRKHVAAVREESGPFVLCGPNKLPKALQSRFVICKREAATVPISVAGGMENKPGPSVVSAFLPSLFSRDGFWSSPCPGHSPLTTLSFVYLLLLKCDPAQNKWTHQT